MMAYALPLNGIKMPEMPEPIRLFLSEWTPSYKKAFAFPEQVMLLRNKNDDLNVFEQTYDSDAIDRYMALLNKLKP